MHPSLWLRVESNHDLELRKLLYYPLYYEALLMQNARHSVLYFAF